MGDTVSGARRGRFATFFASLQGSPFVFFCFALIVSSFFKLRALNSRELWLDETYSAYLANLHFSELIRHAAGVVHPPLFYLLLWVWIRIAGDAQSQLRLFSALVSICATLAMFVLARRILGAGFGAFAAALFAFSPMLFVYSMEVRASNIALSTFSLYY